jgi:K+-sensing histidine kinase KdpD
MVCVTQQKTCDRLIKYGFDVLGDRRGELFIIHVAQADLKFMDHEKDSDALEYLYEKARDYGANLTVIRSADILETLVELTAKNKITAIILGAGNDSDSRNSIQDQLAARVKDSVAIEVIPAL